jgi:hypothetical protein
MSQCRAAIVPRTFRAASRRDKGTGVVSRGSLPVEAKGRSFCFHLSQGNESGGGWEAKGCSF